MVSEEIAVATQFNISYEEIIGGAVEGMFITSKDGTYILANKSLSDIYGYQSPNELIASVKNIGEDLYVDPKARGRFKEQMTQHNTIQNFEVEIYTKQGQKKWIRESVRSVYSESGSFLYYEGFVTDITEIIDHREKIITQNNQLNDLNANLNRKVEERTKALNEQKQTIERQNKGLVQLLQEVTKAKVTRKATLIAFGLTLILFLLSEGFLEPIIESNFGHNIYINLALKGVIALMIKPFEFLAEKFLYRRMSEKYVNKMLQE